MKKMFLAILTVISLSAFSQSYLVMDNGIVITTDQSGFAYDFGHYAFPQKISLKGGHYFVEEGNILATIDENGLFYRKYELIPEKILGNGMNYFISEEGFLYAIDKKGYVKVSESEIYKNAINFGGNYFTVATNPKKTELDLYTVSDSGEVSKAIVPSLKIKDIISFGGTYFMNNRGVVFTVSSDGIVGPMDHMRVGIITKKGGNYFIDSSGFFYTVASTGELLIPGIPLNMKVSSVLRLGSNYFIDQAGAFFVVDKDGNVFERVMRDHDFRLAKIISL